MEDKKIPLLAVVGPTASGKTALAVQLAKKYEGEIVSADSMQIYREISIATAKPDPLEQEGIPHHLIDCASINEEYNVARYVADAAKIIAEIAGRGKLPILAGGTGLYISSLVDNIVFSPSQRNDSLREALWQRIETEGAASLLQELRTFDPEMAASLHPNNCGRIVRAIEIYRTTGITMTEHNRRSRATPAPYRLCMLGIDYKNRQDLYHRIDLRVDRMIQAGLLEEARWFLNLPNAKTSAQAIGYKELSPYFKGEISLDDAVENLKRETRRYAKRQLTWFRRDKRVHWYYVDEHNSFMDYFSSVCETVESSGLL